MKQVAFVAAFLLVFLAIVILLSSRDVGCVAIVNMFIVCSEGYFPVYPPI